MSRGVVVHVAGMSLAGDGDTVVSGLLTRFNKI